MHCKHFPGLLASEGSLEQASTELDRTYEQVKLPPDLPCETPPKDLVPSTALHVPCAHHSDAAMIWQRLFFPAPA